MKRRLIHAANLLIAVGLATAVIVTSRPWEAWQFDGRFLAALAASLVLNGFLVFVWAHRHALVLSAAGADVAPRELAWLVTFSNTANNLTPAASGEIARAWFLNRQFGVTYERAGAAIVFERVFMFGLMALTALLAGLAAVGPSAPITAIAALAVVSYIFVLPGLLAPLSRRFASEPSGGRIKRLLHGIFTGGLSVWSNRSVAAKTALWSAGSFTSMALIFYFAAAISGLQLNAAETWALVGGATAVGVISALPFGLGAAELSAIGIGELLGFDSQAVAAAFVLYRLFFTFPLALAGAAAYGKLTLTRAEEPA